VTLNVDFRLRGYYRCPRCIACAVDTWFIYDS